MTREEMRQIVFAFPGVEDGLSWNTPSIKAYGKFLTRLREEDESVVLMGVTRDEREMLIEAEPQTFHLTPHYENFDTVLARIGTLHPGSFRRFIERRWRKLAPKKVVKDWDAAQGG